MVPHFLNHSLFFKYLALFRSLFRSLFKSLFSSPFYQHNTYKPAFFPTVVIHMGWLSTLFKKAVDDDEQQRVPLDQLMDWFLEQSDPLLSSIKEDLHESLNDVQHEVSSAKEALRLIQEAVLHNDNIPEKAKQVMEGNRASYIKFASAFLNSIRIPDEATYDSIHSFVASYEERLQLFQKASQRNHYILQEFFKNEADDVLERLHDLDKAMRGLLDNDYKKLLDLKKKISSLELSKKNKAQLFDDIDQEEQALSLNDRMIVATNRHVQHLKTSPLYFELERLHKQKESAAMKIKHLEGKLSSFFLQVERALKKYAYFMPADQKIIDEYHQAPLRSLLSDPDLRIASILRSVSQMVRENRIDLGEKEQEKTLAKLEEMKEDTLRSTMRLYGEAKEQLDHIDKNLRLNTIQQQLEESEYKLAHLLQKEKRIKDSLAKLRQQEEKSNDQAVLQEIERSVSEAIGKTIVITTERQEAEQIQ